MILKVFQVYFEDSQLPSMVPSYVPFKNEDCTVFFENSVIKKLIHEKQHEGAKYFGVVSHSLREKIKTRMYGRLGSKMLSRARDFDDFAFKHSLIASEPDVMCYHQFLEHNPIAIAEAFHHGFTEAWQKILFSIGMDWKPEDYQHNIYCNSFVARSHVYERYVNEILSPAMEVMKRMPELMHTSGYPVPLPIPLQNKWNISRYPLHPFICERLFSYFVHLNKFEVKYY